ncbi:MAG TPA: hypothetical protein VHM67_15560, partial [Gemmatimonadaceae bacterium]|nr:hypothetical protein [Gemmatimonadaceae bacterium]
KPGPSNHTVTNANASRTARLPLVGVVRACRVAWVVFALALAAPPAAAQHPLVSIPLDDPVYPVFAALDAAGCRHARVSAYRPWLVRDVRKAADAALRDSACAKPAMSAALREVHGRFTRDTFDLFSSGGDVRVGGSVVLRATGLSGGEFGLPWRGIRPTSEGDLPFAAVARGRIAWTGERVAAVTEAVGYTSRRNDPSVRQRALRNTSGAVDFGESYVNFAIADALVFSLGRSDEAWLGTGRESIVLSAHGPSLDRILLTGRWRRIEGRALLATLSQVELTPLLDTLPGTEARRFFRYLVGHALTIRPSRTVELTIGETAVLARGTRTIELAYANPLMPFVITQNDTSRFGGDANDNLQIFGGAILRSGGSRLDIEALVDDIQIDAKDRKTVQDQLAWRVKGTQALPWLALGSAAAEYRHVNSFTYLRAPYATAFQNYDQPLGSELGPDADMIRGSIEAWPRTSVRGALSAGLWRQGAQRLDARPGATVNGTGSLPYPSVSLLRPFVQRALVGGLEVGYYTTALQIASQIEVANVRHPANRPEPTASYVRTQVTGRYAFRIP